jgi:hypothetical protein
MAKRIAMTMIALFFVCLSANAQTTEVSASLTTDKAVVLTLKANGDAEYQALSLASDGTLNLIQSMNGSWGAYKMDPGVTWLQLAGHSKARRYFWVKVNIPDGGATLDFTQVGNRLLQVGKTGSYQKRAPDSDREHPAEVMDRCSDSSN